jgi:Fe-S cluster assembly protein SufD
MATTTRTGFNRAVLEQVSQRDLGATGQLRERSYQQFEIQPMPSPETEEWRYTDLRSLDLDGFTAAAFEPTVASIDEVKPDILEAAGTGERSGLAVQHNSTLVATQLGPEAAARGVTFGSLDQAPAEFLEAWLHRAVQAGRTRFTSLHAAFRTGGTFLLVPKGERLEAPIETITYVDHPSLAVFPHTVVVVEDGAEVTFVDRYASPPLSGALSDAVVEIYAGPGSNVRYVSLQEWGPGMTHVSVQRALIARDAQLRSLSVAFGASLARAEAESILEGAGGSSEMLGVYFGDGDQHLDHRSIQDHIGDNTSSDLLYKGALRDRSQAIYTGTVIIERGAHKCDAYQTNRNILLSETAKAQSVPNLEIISNDPVRCGHAASVGPIDEEALFYMQSRGIGYREAQRLIVRGFFQEVLDRITLPEIKSSLEARIEEELDAG